MPIFLKTTTSDEKYVKRMAAHLLSNYLSEVCYYLGENNKYILVMAASWLEVRITNQPEYENIFLQEAKTYLAQINSITENATIENFNRFAFIDVKKLSITTRIFTKSYTKITFIKTDFMEKKADASVKAVESDFTQLLVDQVFPDKKVVLHVLPNSNFFNVILDDTVVPTEEASSHLFRKVKKFLKENNIKTIIMTEVYCNNLPLSESNNFPVMVVTYFPKNQYSSPFLNNEKAQRWNEDMKFGKSIGMLFGELSYIDMTPLSEKPLAIYVDTKFKQPIKQNKAIFNIAYVLSQKLTGWHICFDMEKDLFVFYREGYLMPNYIDVNNLLNELYEFIKETFHDVKLVDCKQIENIPTTAISFVELLMDACKDYVTNISLKDSRINRLNMHV